MFASVGGLALLAEHLPVLYSEVSRQPVLPDTMDNTAVSDVAQDQWVSVDSSDLNEVRFLLTSTFLLAFLFLLVCLCPFVVVL